MPAATTDKFKKAGASTVTTLAAPGKALAASSITVGSTTNYPTDTGIVIAIRVVDSEGELVAGTYTEWRATVTSGTTLAIETTPVYGSDQVYAAGSTTQVFIPLSSYAQAELVDGILSQHKQTGAHSDVTADSLTVANNIDVNDSSTAIRDTSDNELLKFAKTASAVNELTVKNAATGNAPQVQATGSDTNVGLNLVPKGTGEVQIAGTPMSGAWQDWTPTFTGFSSNPTGVVARYKQVGKTVFLSITMQGNGTSNSTSMTMTLPVSANTTSGAAWMGSAQALDNSTVQSSPGLLIVYAVTPTVITCFPNHLGGPWTASGGKRYAFATLTYEAA